MNTDIDTGKKHYFIAIDGGGTKTAFALVDMDGNIVKKTVLSGSNPNICGMGNACNILRSGIADLICDCALKITGIFAGISGSMSGDNTEKLTAFLKKEFSGTAIHVESDISNVIASANFRGPCVAAIIGTGSVVFAFDGRELHRAGGWGYLFDSAGSGYDIGRDTIAACLSKDDGLTSPSLLTDLAEARLGGHAWEHLAELYSTGRDFIASFSRVAFEACRRGDKPAAAIIVRSVDRMATLIRFAACKYKTGRAVVITGGLVSCMDVLGPMFDDRLEGKFDLIVPDKDPIDGACRRALEVFKQS